MPSSHFLFRRCFLGAPASVYFANPRLNDGVRLAPQSPSLEDPFAGMEPESRIVTPAVKGS